MDKPSSQKRTLGIVFLTVFLDLVGFGIIIPIQPFFAEKLGASPAVVTWLGGSFSLMQFLFAPFWGRLSDRIGRRPVMLVSIGTAAVGYLLFGLAHSLSLLFASRMLAGFGAANIGTAQAIIADSTTPETRAKGMGLIGAAFGLGFIFGPAIGGLFSQVSLATPAFVAAGLGLLNWCLAFSILPETYPLERRGKNLASANRPGFSWKAFQHAMRHVNVAPLFLIYGIYTIAFSLMEQDLGLFIERKWIMPLHPGAVEFHGKHAAALTAYFLIVVGLTATVIQGGLIGRLAKKFGERKLLTVGTALVAVALMGIPIVGKYASYGCLLFVAFVMATGTGLTNPSVSSLLSQSVDPDEQGGVLGLAQSLAALGRVIGPLMAGILFEILTGLPFWVGAFLLLICFALTMTIAPDPRRSSVVVGGHG